MRNIFKKKSIEKLKLSLRQRKVTELIEAMLSSDVEVYIAPISNEYFIVDSKNSINIVLSNTYVRVANHEYLYEVGFSLGSMEKYMDLANSKIEERTNRIKKELFRNEVELLTKIKNNYVG